MAMNQLDRKTRAQILTLLCEGMSIRAITRTLGVGKNTVARLQRSTRCNGNSMVHAILSASTGAKS